MPYVIRNNFSLRDNKSRSVFQLDQENPFTIHSCGLSQADSSSTETHRTPDFIFVYASCAESWTAFLSRPGWPAQIRHNGELDGMSVYEALT